MMFRFVCVSASEPASASAPLLTQFHSFLLQRPSVDRFPSADRPAFFISLFLDGSDSSDANSTDTQSDSLTPPASDSVADSVSASVSLCAPFEFRSSFDSSRLLLCLALISLEAENVYTLECITTSRHYRFLGAARLLLAHLKNRLFSPAGSLLIRCRRAAVDWWPFLRRKSIGFGINPDSEYASGELEYKLAVNTESIRDTKAQLADEQLAAQNSFLRAFVERLTKLKPKQTSVEQQKDEATSAAAAASAAASNRVSSTIETEGETPSHSKLESNDSSSVKSREESAVASTRHAAAVAVEYSPLSVDELISVRQPLNVIWRIYGEAILELLRTFKSQRHWGTPVRSPYGPLEIEPRERAETEKLLIPGAKILVLTEEPKRKYYMRLCRGTILQKLPNSREFIVHFDSWNDKFDRVFQSEFLYPFGKEIEGKFRKILQEIEKEKTKRKRSRKEKDEKNGGKNATATLAMAGVRNVNRKRIKLESQERTEEAKEIKSNEQ